MYLTFSAEQIETLNKGYDADCDGYSFENAAPEFGNNVARDPDGILSDYFDNPALHDVFFAAWDGNHSWPEFVVCRCETTGDYEFFLRRSVSLLHGSDRTCSFCEGDGCDRCDCGDGYVESPGGSVALYEPFHDAQDLLASLVNASEPGADLVIPANIVDALKEHLV